MLNRLPAILFFLVLTGCTGSLKSTWNDFRAYHNTYYNAKKYFGNGLEKVNEQPLELNPNSPVRVHRPPASAGGDEFQIAIGKAAKVLRDYPDSKWADDALYLIARSYYYRREFHTALEHFEELYHASDSDRMRQLAVIGKGKTLLETGRYEDGVVFLRQERENLSTRWKPELLAEAKIVEAEHHAFLGNWRESSDLLSSSLSVLSDKRMLGRVYFLFGQMLENEKRFGEAYYAFLQVSEHFPGFEYIYWAVVKQAEVARQAGNYELAHSLLNRLRNDDKYFEKREDIAFYIARTYEMEGDIKAAENGYLNLLGSPVRLSDEVRSSAYFRLGKIYSEHKNRFNLAEAYFDSASSLRNNSGNGAAADREEAGLLARNLGTYNKLKQQIREADSLLWLGSLPAERLDSVLRKIREQKLLELREEKERGAETMLNVQQEVGTGAYDRLAADTERYGFLYHKNSRMQQQAKAEFRFIWGNRPPVDNWRRAEVIERQGIHQRSRSSTQPDNSTQSPVIELDVTQIPADEKSRKELKQRKLQAKYELGNLFFINMNRPDSARKYYREVIDRSEEESDLKPRAIYSLFELYYVEGKTDSLHFWGNVILERYEGSEFADRVKKRLNRPDTTENMTDRIRKKYQEVLNSNNRSRAQQLRALALANRSKQLAPHIHYRAIENYIEQAKTAPGGEKETLPDSSGISADTYYYLSTEWDSVLVVLEEYDSVFTDGPHRQQVSVLYETLKEQRKKPSGISTCNEEGVVPEMIPGETAFLESVDYPENLANLAVSGSITFSFLIDRDGTIISFRRESQQVLPAIEESFTRAIENHLSFAPLDLAEGTEAVHCTITFPVQLNTD